MTAKVRAGEETGVMSLTDTSDALQRAYRVGVSLP
jgi:hypothetical protein